MIHVSGAADKDAVAMSEILAEILQSWNSQRPRSPEHILANYIHHRDRIKCSVARDEAGAILGFQSLKIAGDDNIYDLPRGWGIVGTYVAVTAGRKGVGRALFLSSIEAARLAGVAQIDASIRETNIIALSYYEAMGFETYRTRPGAISKRLIVT